MPSVMPHCLPWLIPRSAVLDLGASMISGPPRRDPHGYHPLAGLLGGSGSLAYNMTAASGPQSSSAAGQPSRQGIHGLGATPGGRGPACENTQGPAPVPSPRLGGSLPSTSVLPSAAQAAGWQRPQLQAPARDSRIRRLRIFTGAMRASTPNVSCTLQYGTRRGLLIGSVPPRAEPSARCRCVASAPALPACGPCQVE